MACASRSLSTAEKNYAATKLECLALVFGVTHFRPYLEHAHFDVYTDHYGLKYMRNMKQTSAIYQRWFMELENFDFTVHYKPGKQQNHVDCLSRLPQDTIQGHAYIDNIRSEITMERQELWNAFDCEKWPKWTSTEIQPYLTRTPDGHVLDNHGRIMVGPLETQLLLQQIHTSPFDGGHLGAKKILEKFRATYRGHRDTATATQVCQQCPHCQVSKDYQPRRQHQPGTIRANGRGETLSIDVEGPFRTEGVTKIHHNRPRQVLRIRHPDTHSEPRRQDDSKPPGKTRI